MELITTLCGDEHTFFDGLKHHMTTSVEVIRTSVNARAESIAALLRDQDDIQVRLDELLIRNVDEYLLIKEFREMTLQKKRSAARSALAEPSLTPNK